MGAGLEGFDFSHEGVKRVVGLFMSFVHAIASAPRGFLYFKQRIHDNKNKNKNRKEVKSVNEALTGIGEHQHPPSP